MCICYLKFSFSPQSVLQPKDALNQRYPRKRALYLAGLAQHLLSSPDIGSLRYSCLRGNRLRPLLLVTPPGINVTEGSCCRMDCRGKTRLNLGCPNLNIEIRPE